MLKLVIAAVLAVFAATVLSFPADEPPPAPSGAAPGDNTKPAKPFDLAIQKCFEEDKDNKFHNSTDPCILECAIKKANLDKNGTLDADKFFNYLKEFEPTSFNQTGPWVHQCWVDCKGDQNEKCAAYRHFFICLRISPLIPSKVNPVPLPVPVPGGDKPAPSGDKPAPSGDKPAPSGGDKPSGLPSPSDDKHNTTAPVAPTK